MAYIGNTPETTYGINVKEYVATEGQTVFPATYDEDVEVYSNGSLLASDAYTATDGVQVVLVSSAAAGDVIRINGYADIATFSGLVTSVAGKTGDVAIVKADVGLADVDNTSDLNKPISTATQTELNNINTAIGDITTALDTINGEVI